MKELEFMTYLDEEMSKAQKHIPSDLTKLTEFEHLNLGRVKFLTALKNVINKTSSAEDVGTIGAANDVVQKLGLLGSAKTLVALATS